MKGNTAEPKCGFSRKMIALLQEAGLDFGTFDILEDQVKIFEFFFFGIFLFLYLISYRMKKNNFPAYFFSRKLEKN